MNKWTKGSTISYATSIASTWAWAPALFISGTQAYNDGMTGFLMFFVPNAITLFLFGLFAYYIRTHYSDGDSVTVENMVRNAGRQSKIHLAMTMLILFCSCCMQLMGIFMVIENFTTNKIIVSILVLLVALWTTRNGIKSCIETDLVKYFTIIVIGFALLTQIDYSNISFVGHSNKSIVDMWTGFGIPTALGLLAAPYIDSTFVQRMYCIPKEKLIKTFGIASVLFAVIPVMYSIFGFAGINGINKHFTGACGVLLLIAVVAALMSTLDSNLCALSAIAEDYIPDYKKTVTILFYALVAWIMIKPPFNITGLFTLYCTIRCTMLLPTLFIASGYYDKNRLFYSSLVSCIVGCVGYYLTANFLFTLFALITPLLGISGRKIYGSV